MLKSIRIKVSEMEYKRVASIAKKYQSFDSVEEMDEHIDAFLNEYGIYLSKGEQIILESIQRFSLEAFGVSWRLVDTIVENTGYSVRTVQRTITKLEKWGLLERVPLLRPNGKRWLNLIVIQRQDNWLDVYNDTDIDEHFDGVVETPEVNGDNASNGENEKGVFSNHFNLLNSLSINKRKDEPSIDELDSTFVPSNVPKEFVEAARPFYNAKTIFNLWNRVRIACDKIGLTEFDVMDYIIEAFKNSIFAKKRGHIRKDFSGYFYGTLCKILSAVKREITFNENNNNPLFYNFLEGINA